MRTIAIVADGIIRAHIGHAPIPGGKILALALAQSYKLAILTDEDNVDLLDHWLVHEGFPPDTYLTCRHPGDPDSGPGRLRQIQRLRRLGCVIDYVLESDPTISAHLMGEGIPVLHYLHPAYAHPNFRPDADRTITPWAELEQEVDRLRELRNTDPRLRPAD